MGLCVCVCVCVWECLPPGAVAPPPVLRCPRPAQNPEPRTQMRPKAPPSSEPLPSQALKAPPLQPPPPPHPLPRRGPARTAPRPKEIRQDPPPLTWSVAWWWRGGGLAGWAGWGGEEGGGGGLRLPLPVSRRREGGRRGDGLRHGGRGQHLVSKWWCCSWPPFECNCYWPCVSNCKTTAC